MKELENYCFMGISQKVAEPVYRLISKYHKTLFTDEAVQDLFFNWRLIGDDGSVPTSYMEIMQHAPLRTKTIAHLAFLTTAINTATKIDLAIVKKNPQGLELNKDNGILYPNILDTFSLTNKDGLDYFALEAFQKKWFENPNVVSNIREFEKALNKAFDEFNKQMILGMIGDANSQFSKLDTPGATIQEEIKKTLGQYEKISTIMTALDNAIYGRAQNLFSQCAPHYSKLQESEFGKMFLIQPEDEKKFIEALYSR